MAKWLQAGNAVDAKTRDRLHLRARIIKALAHPSRLLIVGDLLANGERCVCELKVLVGADMSTVSRHLTLLRVAGIVADERRGPQVYYRLRSPHVQAFVRDLEDALTDIVQEQAALMRKAS